MNGELSINELRLNFQQFKNVYIEKQYIVFNELCTCILEQMGIFLKTLQNAGDVPGRRTDHMSRDKVQKEFEEQFTGI